MNKIIIIGLCLAPALASQGALVTNGNMAQNAYAAGGNNATFADLDQGWAVKSKSNLDFDTNPGTITWDGPDAGLLADGLAQINSVTTESGNTLTFSFDWTPATGSTTPDLEYQVVGWKVTGSPVAANKVFNNINGATKVVSGLEGNADAIDLLSGNNGGAGNSSPSVGLFSGTAGSTESASITIDLSSYAVGLSDISDYDYIGIRFHIAGDKSDLSAVGSTLDNVSLTDSSIVPTPPITSHDTGYTITKVRNAKAGATEFIVGTSYEGTVLALGYDGTALWTNALSGYINHDLWSGDLTGDGTNEVLAANADGTIYCMDGTTGADLWQFKTNSAPMFSICTATRYQRHHLCRMWRLRLEHLLSECFRHAGQNHSLFHLLGCRRMGRRTRRPPHRQLYSPRHRQRDRVSGREGRKQQPTERRQHLPVRCIFRSPFPDQLEHKH